MYSRSNPAWGVAFAKVLVAQRLILIDDPEERQRAIECTSALTEKERDALLAWPDLPGVLERGLLSDAELGTLASPCQERCAAWEKILLLAEQIDDDMNDIEYRALRNALLLRGLLKKRRGRGAAETERIEKEADNILRLLKHGFNLSPIGPRGPQLGNNWFTIGPTWGKHRADEALRNFIEASTSDPDYWEALTVIKNRLIEKGQPLPDDLRSWFRDVNEGRRKPPPKTTGGPPYANEARNMWIAYAESVLRYLGMTRDDALYAIKNVIDKKSSRTPGRSVDDENLSFEGIRTASRNLTDDLPPPWGALSRPVTMLSAAGSPNRSLTVGDSLQGQPIFG